jgi:hypothetical protein
MGRILAPVATFDADIRKEPQLNDIEDQGALRPRVGDDERLMV